MWGIDIRPLWIARVLLETAGRSRFCSSFHSKPPLPIWNERWACLPSSFFPLFFFSLLETDHVNDRNCWLPAIKALLALRHSRLRKGFLWSRPAHHRSHRPYMIWQHLHWGHPAKVLYIPWLGSMPWAAKLGVRRGIYHTLCSPQYIVGILDVTQRLQLYRPAIESLESKTHANALRSKAKKLGA